MNLSKVFARKRLRVSDETAAFRMMIHGIAPYILR